MANLYIGIVPKTLFARTQREAAFKPACKFTLVPGAQR